MMCSRRDCAWIRLDGLRFKILTKLPLVGWSGVDQLADQEVLKNKKLISLFKAFSKINKTEAIRFNYV